MTEDKKETYILETPIELGDTVYETLDLREPRAGELEKAWNKNQMTMTLKLLSLVTRVPVAALRQMTQTDMQQASDILGNFSPEPPETSEI